MQGENAPLMASASNSGTYSTEQNRNSVRSQARSEVVKPGLDHIKCAIYLALGVNVILFIAKIAAFMISLSLAVVASLLDSFLDLVSQVVIWYGHRTANKRGGDYPAGRTRLSPVGILVCATLMFAGSIEVIRQSMVILGEGLTDRPPKIEFGFQVIVTLLGATSIKVLLFLYSRYHPVCAKSADVQVVADDHRNDIITNMGALTCGLIAFHEPRYWWFDPVGAIVLSLYIAVNWYWTGKENMDKLVGVEADPDVVAEIYEIIDTYEDKMVELDWLRCYHLGLNVVVEVEIVMPGHLTLCTTHDTALELQQDIEALESVERAYVHVDYKHRDYDEHKHHSFPFGGMRTDGNNGSDQGAV